MMQPGQVFIAISHSGSTLDVIEAVQAANKAGATTIGIVSYAKSPLSKVVKYTLLVGSSETGYRFVKRQSQNNPNVWVSLGQPNAAVATATAR